MKPLVSVYIPTHNRRKMLERAIRSVLAQTYENIEIIVIDDGSTDDTQKFMQDFVKRYKQVRYLRHETPKGANVARNYAIREANGYFLTGLDDDDEFIPERVEKLVDAYDDEYAYVFSMYEEVYDDGHTECWGAKSRIITLDDMLYRNETGNQVLTTKEMFVKAGMFDELLPSTQDYDMWIRLLQEKPFAKMVTEPLYKTYKHEGERITLSRNKFKGRLHFYNKHKASMTKSQKRAYLVTLRNLRGRDSRLIHYRHLYDKKDWPRLFMAHFKKTFLTKLGRK